MTESRINWTVLWASVAVSMFVIGLIAASDRAKERDTALAQVAKLQEENKKLSQRALWTQVFSMEGLDFGEGVAEAVPLGNGEYAVYQYSNPPTENDLAFLAMAKESAEWEMCCERLGINLMQAKYPDSPDTKKWGKAEYPLPDHAWRCNAFKPPRSPVKKP